MSKVIEKDVGDGYVILSYEDGSATGTAIAPKSIDKGVGAIKALLRDIFTVMTEEDIK